MLMSCPTCTITHYSLLSVGNLCDADYEVIFDRREVRIMDKQEVIMRGQRHAYTGLWHMEPQEILNNVITEPTASHQMEYANAVIGAPTTAAMVKFDHAALFPPALSTLNNALGNNWLFNFPGLSSKSLRKHPPQSAATAKGHLDQQRMNQRSTTSRGLEKGPNCQKSRRTYPECRCT
jgi:hypothetical protein